MPFNNQGIADVNSQEIQMDKSELVCNEYTKQKMK